MNQREPTQTFEAARRLHLIEATIDALAEVGFKAASLSQIARRAEVSTGLFAHYFNDKDGLLEATLRFMAARLVQATRQRLRQAKSARERLYAVPDAALADTEFERRTSAVWLAFWGQITHSTRYQRVQIIYQRRMISNLRHDLRALVPNECVATYATIIASLIDGLWLRSHAAPASPDDAAEARRIVRLLIDRLVDGDPPQPNVRLPSGARPAPPGDVAPERPCPDTALPTPTMHDPGPKGFIPARQGDIDQMVRRAQAGLAAWRAMTRSRRAEFFQRSAAIIRDRGDHLAAVLSENGGRPIRRTRQDIPRAADGFARAGGSPFFENETRGHQDIGLRAQQRWEPAGLVALDGAGHWPLSATARRIARALADGNAVLLQTCAMTFEACHLLVQLLEEAGLPPGLVTVPRTDAETARLIDTHPAIDLVDRDAPPKSATIVCSDADISEAATAILRGPRPWMPTDDWSEDRIFVERGAHEALRCRLVTLAAAMRCGDPLDASTEIGPLRSASHLDRVLGAIDAAVGQGAIVRTGGVRTGGVRTGGVRRAGHGLAPTVVDDCLPDMPLVGDRLYAPVLTLIPFDDAPTLSRFLGPQEAIGMICGDVESACRLADRLRFGVCGITDSPTQWNDDDISSWDELVSVEHRYRKHSRIVMRSGRFGLPRD